MESQSQAPSQSIPVRQRRKSERLSQLTNSPSLDSRKSSKRTPANRKNTTAITADTNPTATVTGAGSGSDSARRLRSRKSYRSTNELDFDHTPKRNRAQLDGASSSASIGTPPRRKRPRTSILSINPPEVGEGAEQTISKTEQPDVLETPPLKQAKCDDSATSARSLRYSARTSRMHALSADNASETPSDEGRNASGSTTSSWQLRKLTRSMMNIEDAEENSKANHENKNLKTGKRSADSLGDDKKRVQHQHQHQLEESMSSTRPRRKCAVDTLRNILASNPKRRPSAVVIEQDERTGSTSWSYKHGKDMRSATKEAKLNSDGNSSTDNALNQVVEIVDYSNESVGAVRPLRRSTRGKEGVVSTDNALNEEMVEVAEAEEDSNEVNESVGAPRELRRSTRGKGVVLSAENTMNEEKDGVMKVVEKSNESVGGPRHLRRSTRGKADIVQREVTEKNEDGMNEIAGKKENGVKKEEAKVINGEANETQEAQDMQDGDGNVVNEEKDEVMDAVEESNESVVAAPQLRRSTRGKEIDGVTKQKEDIGTGKNESMVGSGDFGVKMEEEVKNMSEVEETEVIEEGDGNVVNESMDGVEEWNESAHELWRNERCKDIEADSKTTMNDEDGAGDAGDEEKVEKGEVEKRAGDEAESNYIMGGDGVGDEKMEDVNDSGETATQAPESQEEDAENAAVGKKEFVSGSGDIGVGVMITEKERMLMVDLNEAKKHSHEGGEELPEEKDGSTCLEEMDIGNDIGVVAEEDESKVDDENSASPTAAAAAVPVDDGVLPVGAAHVDGRWRACVKVDERELYFMPRGSRPIDRENADTVLVRFFSTGVVTYFDSDMYVQNNNILALTPREDQRRVQKYTGTHASVNNQWLEDLKAKSKILQQQSDKLLQQLAALNRRKR